ncbi:STAS domain-containing protein [Marinicrinis sediminis]|uniref:Anti-sigma factor antagonist n=1 Tax=Marinicrinis sediminis TaxID=1652465 RepID=A0ABW5R7J9_9BACL
MNMHNDELAQHLTIQERTTADTTTLFLQGKLDLATASTFKQSAEPVVEQADITFKLNLSELSYIDSTGIGILVTLLKRRHQLQAPFVVEEIPPKIKRLFEMTGIMKFLVVQ